MASNVSDSLRIEVTFPLADGRTLVQGPLTYNHDGLASSHSAAFLQAPRFLRAYAEGVRNGRKDIHVEWRVHVALWCATQAATLDGDFAECGVHTGILSGAVMTWLNFDSLPNRTFYLFDTWAGIPEDQISEAERALGVLGMNRKYQNGDYLYREAQEKFARWQNARVVRGRVPESLDVLRHCEQLAYLSMDLNVASAEMAAIELLWPKIVRGGLVLLDDYGWAPHVNQKIAWDNWAQANNLMILSLPTGQGLIRKPT